MSRTTKGKLNELGPQLARLREEVGLTQSQVVGRLQRLKPLPWDCSVVVYSTVETRQRSLSDIELLAILRVLGKSLKDL